MRGIRVGDDECWSEYSMITTAPSRVESSMLFITVGGNRARRVDADTTAP
jgi:hypothetical protein